MPLCRKSYSERLADLKIYSLERRRERMQILYLYKVILHKVPNPGFEWTYCTRNKLTIKPKTSGKVGWAHTLRNNSFSVVGPKLFNSLPSIVRELPDTTRTTEDNISYFKRNVDKYLGYIPDTPGSANSLLYHDGIDYGFRKEDFVPCERKKPQEAVNQLPKKKKTNNNNNTTTTNNNKKGRKRRNNFGQLTEEAVQRLANKAPTWDD